METDDIESTVRESNENFASLKIGADSSCYTFHRIEDQSRE